MNFTDHLKRQREGKKLSVEEAAAKVRLGVPAYRDRESGRTSVNVPERVGLLVALGVPFEEALEIAVEPDVHDFGNWQPLTAYKEAQADPFVSESADEFILYDRGSGANYPIGKDTVKTAENVLGWIDHLCDKSWVTTEHIEQFLMRACMYLGLKIHQ